MERVQNGVVKQCLIELENANRQIAQELKKTNGIHTKARYNELRKYLKSVAKELKRKVNKDMDIDEFIDYELQAQIKLYKKYGQVQLIAPNKEQLITTATFTPFTNTTSYENYLDSFELNFFNIWDSNVRAGYLSGFTTPQIVRKTMGSVAKNGQVADVGAIQQLRTSIMRNTRTALQSFAMETHRMIYEQNQELFAGYKWYATLDRRTCVVCGEKEGHVYEKYSDIGDTPPEHYNCRCTILPILKGDYDLEDTRASMNGQVDAKLTFEDWLAEQTADIQRDVLGETRYNMFKNGAELKDFVLDNRILTISELKEMGV